MFGGRQRALARAWQLVKDSRSLQTSAIAAQQAAPQPDTIEVGRAQRNLVGLVWLLRAQECVPCTLKAPVRCESIADGQEARVARRRSRCGCRGPLAALLHPPPTTPPPFNSCAPSACPCRCLWTMSLFRSPRASVCCRPVMLRVSTFPGARLRGGGVSV